MNQMEQAIWAAHALFDRGKVTGSTGNISFRDGKQIMISGSGSCFGNLSEHDFSAIDIDGQWISGKKPSKEYPLHLMLYRHFPDAGAVLHTHSQYAVLWSCLPGRKDMAPWPAYTPYLQMRIGTVKRIAYAPPGTDKLFCQAEEALGNERGYLLENHGPIIASDSILSAFYDMEELEEAAKISWILRNEEAHRI